MSFSIQHNEVDRKLLDLAKETKIFIEEMNNSVIFTRADIGQCQTLDDKMYVSKVTEMLQDTETYEVIKRDPTKGVVTSLRGMLVKWRDADYIRSIGKFRPFFCKKYGFI